MSLLDIYVYPAPILRQDTKVVGGVTDEHRRLIDDMFETMYAAKGIGLAAPQVGRTERLAVIDANDKPYAVINPEIILAEGSQKGEEGCLSIPEIYGDVERAYRVVVRALGRDGTPFEVDATELEARCLQHEIDHLHGKLFIDHLGLFKRRAALAKWERLRKGDKSLTRKVTPEVAARHHRRDDEL